MSDNEHYVPQFLLKNFAGGKKNNHIHVFDKHKGASFLANVRNVASETGFYELDGFKAEKLFKEIDKEAPIVINKIKQKKSLSEITPEEIAWLYAFVAFQILRTKQFRESLIDLDKSLEIKIREIGFDPKKVEDFACRDQESIKSSSVQFLFKYYPNVISALISKRTFLMESPSGSEFYISDNPVTLHNENTEPYGNLGLMVKGVEIYLPISPYLTLAFWCPSIHKEMLNVLEGMKGIKGEKLARVDEAINLITNYIDATASGESLKIDPENALMLNSLQVAFSHRFVFSANSKFSFVEKLISDNPKFKSGPRFTVG